MNITEVDLLDYVFRYKADLGLTAKDVDNEELLDFARWLLPQLLNKHDVLSWISVDEQLPDLDTRCLIVESDGNIQICNYCRSIWNYPKNSVGFLDEQDEQPSMCYPTHWMPLPRVPSA